jgi:hypothetical protein
MLGLTQRPNWQFTLHGTYFNDDLLGASHEVKVGFEWRHTKDQSTSGSAGNMRYNFNFGDSTINWQGIDPVLDTDATADNMRDEFGIDIRRLYFYRGRWSYGPEGTFHVSGFFQDTIAFGRFTLKVGLRYDRQQSYFTGQERRTIFTEDTDELYHENYYEIQQRHLDDNVDAAILAIFPGITIPAVARKDTVPWSDFSPRLGLTWDVTGDGRTIAKLSGALYYGRMPSWPSYMWQRGGAGGGINFWWYDANDDDSVGFTELYWADYSDPERTAYPAFVPGTGPGGYDFNGNWAREDGLMWSGYDPTDPGATTDPWYIVDPNWSADRTYEVLATVEREVMTDFAVALDFTWRKYNNWWTSRNYADTFGGRLLERSDYVQQTEPVPTNYIPSGETEAVDLYEAEGRYVYGWAAGINDVYGWYPTNTPSDYFDIYIGFNIRATKRLSNKWMAMGSFTWQDQRTYWGDTWPLNPTNQWAEDGKLFAYQLGGSSGKDPMRTFSSWMIKMQGLYQLPYDINVSATFNARQGHLVDERVTIRDRNAPNPNDISGSIKLRPYGDARLPTFWNLNLRVEKVLRVGDAGKVYLMIDMFNVFNNNILNRKLDVTTGRITVSDTPPSFYRYVRSGEPNEVLNPRIFRFGVRFQF